MYICVLVNNFISCFFIFDDIICFMPDNHAIHNLTHFVVVLSDSGLVLQCCFFTFQYSSEIAPSAEYPAL